MSEFSKNLKKLRKEHDVMQKQLAEIMGVSIRQYQRYEKGDQEASISGLIALANFYHVSIDYLVGRTENPNVNLFKE